MTNRSGRAVGDIPAFRPRVNTPEGLPDVAQPQGADSEALFSGASDLARVFGHYADDAAKTEGERAGTIAGNDPNFRPSGDTTIRGKAFEKAATATYLDQLDANMRERAMGVYQQHKDNPVQLNAELAKVKGDILKNDAFPEIHGQVNASFQRLVLPFQIRALDVQEERAKDSARAANMQAGVVREATAVAQIEANPYEPKTRAVAKQALDESAAADQRLVASGTMTAEQAMKNKISRERDFSVREAGAFIGNIKTVEDLDRYEARYKEQKAKGELGPIGQDKLAMDQVEGVLAQQRTRLQTDGKRLTLSVEKQSESILKRMENGYIPPPDEISRHRAAASQAPDGPALVEKLDRRMAWTRAGLANGPAYIEAQSKALRAAAGANPSAAVADDLQFLDGLGQSFRRAVQEDPAGLARKNGIIPAIHLPMDNPQALAAGIRERAAAVAAMPEGINPNRKVFEPGEIIDLKRQVDKGGEGAVAAVEAIVQGAGKDAPRIMREIGGTAPELAQAGMILAGGGSKQAARDIIAGVVNRNLEGGAKPMEVDTKTFRKIWVEKTGESMAYNPQDSSRIEYAARAIAATRLRTLADNKDTTAQEIYRQAIDDAVGGQKIDGNVYGGMAKVKPGYWKNYQTPVPPDVRNDRFSSVLGEIRDGDLAGQPVPPADGFKASTLKQAVPVPVPGGYRFAMGEPGSADPKFIPDAQGKPFVLHWDKIAPVLRQRVPGAFIGGK